MLVTVTLKRNAWQELYRDLATFSLFFEIVLPHGILFLSDSLYDNLKNPPSSIKEKLVILLTYLKTSNRLFIVNDNTHQEIMNTGCLDDKKIWVVFYGNSSQILEKGPISTSDFQQLLNSECLELPAEKLFINKINLSTCFRSFKEQFNYCILPEELVENVWNKYFLSLCSYSTKITIVDRYCIQQLYQKGQDSGLYYFLSKLIYQSEKIITIYAVAEFGDFEVVREDFLRKIEFYFQELKNSTKIDYIELYLATEIDEKKVYKKFGHDRYFRFHHVVIDSGRGVDILYGARTSHANTMGLRLYNNNLRIIERTLSEASQVFRF